jgi:branched-chain amino acid transport system permease protein
MVLVMVLRPQGLIPSRRRARELADRAQEAPTNV